MFGNPWTGQITGFFTMTLPVTLYFALFESSSYQATWGKRWQGIKVIYNDGKRLSRGRAVGRTALKFIPWELAHTCIWQLQFNGQKLSPIIFTGLALVWVLAGIYALTLLTSSKKQALYDQLINTYVVNANEFSAS